MEITTSQQLMNYVVMATVAIVGLGKGFAQMQTWGWFPVRPVNGNGNGSLKKSGDMTVESFEGKVRHAVRGELQAITLLQGETNRRLEEIGKTLVRMETILEQQSK